MGVIHGEGPGLSPSNGVNRSHQPRTAPFDSKWVRLEETWIAQLTECEAVTDATYHSTDTVEYVIHLYKGAHALLVT